MNRSRITGDLVSQNNIFVDIANDRVGIGSTIPTTKLDVSGKAQIEGLLVDTVDPVINVGSTYTYKYGYFGDADKHALTVRGNEASLEVFASEQSYHAGSIVLRGGNEGFGFVNNSSDDRLELISFTASANSFALHNNGANLSNYDKVFVANKNGSIDLYHNGSKKFETSSAGATVTGTLRTGDGSTISFSDNVNLEDSSGSGNNRVKLGNGDDLQLYHDGTRSHLSNTTGELRIGQGGTNVELYHSSAKKFETTSTGVEITGTKIILNDNSNITSGTPHTFNYGRGNGATSSLSLYGDESAIEVVSNDDGTHGGSILIRTTTDGAGFVYNPTDNALELTMFSTSNNNFNIHNNGSHTDQDKQLRVVKDGAVELYHNGTKKFETSATGVILSSTDAGSSAEPELKLYRNSASPADADYLGQIKFAGESDTGVERNYAKITGKILDASNGTEDGIIEFAHIKAGSQVITGRWRSDSLQLLNGTNFSVAGTAEITGVLTASGSLDVTGNIDSTVAGGENRLKIETTSSGNPVLNLAAAGSGGHDIFYNRSTNELTFKSQGGSDRLKIAANGDLLPGTDSQYNIGSNTVRFANIYADTLYGDGSNLGGINTDLVSDTSPQLGADLDVNDFDIKNGNQIYEIVSNARHNFKSAGNTIMNINGNGVDFQHGNNTHADSVQSRFGTGNDLAIYHDGSNSYMQHSGTGDLYIDTLNNSADMYIRSKDNLHLRTNSGSQESIVCVGNSGVILHTAGNQKFTTDSDGATITGRLAFTSAPAKAITLADNKRIYFGDGDDMWIGSNGSNGEISGSLFVYNHMYFYDNVRLRLGNSQDLDIYHNGSHSYIIDNGTGDLKLRGSEAVKIEDTSSGKPMITCTKNFGTEIYHQMNSAVATAEVKFATTSTGATITGNLQCNNTLSCGTGLQQANVASFGGGTNNQINIFDGSNTGWGLLLTQSQGSSSASSYHYSTNSSVNKPCAIVNVQNDALHFGTYNTARWRIEHDGHFLPSANNSYDIGSSGYKVRNIYTNDLHLSNEGHSNDVDGTWGSYTIQEGEDDLFLINKRSGKKYKFNLTEVV